MAVSSILSSPSSKPFFIFFPCRCNQTNSRHQFIVVPRLRSSRNISISYSQSQRNDRFNCVSDFDQDNGRGGSLFTDHHRNWSGSNIGNFYKDDRVDDDEDDNDDEDDDDDESDDRSLDLLVRFVQNVFKKVSKRARKAVRSVLPISISTKLVGFSVNGVIILAFLWVLKAFLEVVCTLGSIVFVSILLIRGIWSGISYLQESRNYKGNGFDDERGAWTGAQPTS